MWGDVCQMLPWLLFHHRRASLKEGVGVLIHIRGLPKGAPGDQPTIFFKLHSCLFITTSYPPSGHASSAMVSDTTEHKIHAVAPCPHHGSCSASHLPRLASSGPNAQSCTSPYQPPPILNFTSTRQTEDMVGMNLLEFITSI
jgi:hypothetical protein